MGRRSCKKYKVKISPNPVIDLLKVESEGDEVINSVNISKVTNPNIGISKNGDGYSNKIELNMNSLPAGTYSVEIEEVTGKITTEIIVKF